LQRSDQAETVILHHDIIHNPATVFHFELQWIGTTARYIDDQVRQWNKTIERFGLKLVEAYVTQISDVRERNAFQSCFPVRLSLTPPPVPDRRQTPQDGGVFLSQQHFEYAILRKFDFVVDVEAADLYPPEFDVVYSYRRSPFRYSQFVHRSGVAFVQVLGGQDGFLFLTNRLMTSAGTRSGAGGGGGGGGSSVKSKEQQRPSAAAEEIRKTLHRFCSNKEELTRFFEEEMANIGGLPEEPPPLSI
jgi:DEP domain-containing protein 5